MRALAVVGAVLSMACLGACGGRNDAVALHTTGGSPTSLRTDVATADRVLLATADLPGFDAVPTTSSADATTLQAASSFSSCASATAVLSDSNRTVTSPAFFQGHDAAVSSLAFVAPTDSGARTAMDNLSQADLGGCLTGLFRSVLGLDLVPGTTAVTALVPGPTVGDQSATWHTTIQVTSGGQTVSAYSDLTFFRTGRTVASLFDFQLGSPFPAANRDSLLTMMAGRAA